MQRKRRNKNIQNTDSPMLNNSEYSISGVTKKHPNPAGGWGSSKLAAKKRENGAKMAEIEAYAKNHKVSLTAAMVEFMSR